MKGKLVKRLDRWDLYNEDGSKIASSLLWISRISVKNCQAIERGYDLDELAKMHHKLQYCDGYNPEIALYVEEDFNAGFQKALELMGDKKFSEEDLREAISQTRKGMLYNKKYEDEYIQSLQQTEWDVEIVQEEGKDTFGNAELTWYNPKLDADGCLILKRAE